MRLDEEIDEDDEAEKKNEMDFRVQRVLPRSDSIVADYPQNPYEETRSESLYFSDGLRSVDFVLVWKKLMPHTNDERSDAMNQRDIEEVNKKEAERDERREVFEEHLVEEGLEIEREIVDEEIHFVKIHAPLEVLRRYAEILKLRLPMKEVSKTR